MKSSRALLLLAVLVATVVVPVTASADHTPGRGGGSGAPDGGPQLDPAPSATFNGSFRTWNTESPGWVGDVTYDGAELAILDYPFDDHGPDTDGDDGRSLNPGEYDTLLMGANAGDGAAGDFVYPSDPVFANNAADIAEVRLALDDEHWYALVVMNALVDPARTALTISLVDEFSVIVHGNTASIEGVDVVANADDNTFEVRVPRALHDPSDEVELFVGAGLWDPSASTWLDPDPDAETLPYFDALYDQREPADSYWREKTQAAELAAESADDAGVDIWFAKLRCDDACPLFRPIRVGLDTRVFRSGQDMGEGVFPQTRYSQSTSFPYKLYRSQYQPYSVYVPRDPSGALVILMHYLGGNYMSYPITSRAGVREWAEETGAIVVMPHARGEAGWYEGEAEKDVFEVWRDIARDYAIDRDRVYLAGMSMGGYGAWRLGLLYPDQFARAISWSGPVMPYTIWAAPTPVMYPQANPPACDRDDDGCGLTLEDLFGNGANLPYQVIHGGLDELVPYTGAEGWMERYRARGSHSEFIAYPARRHETTYPGTTGHHVLRWLDGLPARATDPAKVDYTLVRDFFQPAFGLRYDGAYWVDDLELADGVEEGRIIADRSTTAAVEDETFTGTDALGPYHLRRRTPVSAEPDGAMSLSLHGLRSASIDAGEIGWDDGESRTIMASTDTALTLRLAGDFPDSVAVSGVQFAWANGDVLLHLPAGSSVVTIG